MEKTGSILDPKALAKLSSLTLIARTVVEGFISGLHRSLHKGASVEFSEHREYTPGDDPRYLDWKVYGRTDRLYIKDFREETNLKSYILLDASNSMKYGGELRKLDYAIFLAASLGYLMVRQKDAVGLVVFDSRVRKFIKPSATTNHFHFLIENLKNVEPGERTALGEVLHHAATHVRRRGLIILISDLFDEPEQVMKGLSHFKHKHHEVIVFHVLDRKESEFPFEGYRDFVDMETGERVPADAFAVRNAYRHVFREFLSYYQRNCADANMSYARAFTDESFDRFLYRYLTARSKYT